MLDIERCFIVVSCSAPDTRVCLHTQASVMSIWTKDQSKTADARAMAAALAAANAKACQGIYQPPHPSVLTDSLHESFRGWNASTPSA